MPDPIKIEGEISIDVDGQVYTKEDLENLKAGHDANADKKVKLADYEAQLVDVNEKLKKLENKAFNFKKLRDMNDEEKGKLSEAEKALMAKQEELEENQKTFQTTLEDSNKNEALAVLVGTDEEMKKKVLHNYGRIEGSAVTKDEINKKMREAVNMLGVSAPSGGNPVNMAAGFHGSDGSPTGSSQPSKVDGDLAASLGITDEELKKSNLSK